MIAGAADAPLLARGGKDDPQYGDRFPFAPVQVTRTVAALPCDIALAPHPGMVDFWARVERRDQGDAGALIDGTVCRAYAEHARRALEGELAGPVS